MRRGIALFWFALALAVLVALPAPAARAAGPGQAYHPSDLVVRLRPGVDPYSFAASTGLRLRDVRDNKLPGQPIYKFTVVDRTNPGNKARAISGHPGVVYAEPNYYGQVPEVTRRSSWVVGGDAGGYASQWAAARIALPAAHTISQGDGIIVAILDTGVDPEHSALAGRLGPGYDFIDDDDEPYERNDAYNEDRSSWPAAVGHGTHVAGLVALTAPAAQIMALRTLDEEGYGDLWTQVVALRYAFDNGAEVINLSFSFGERSQLFDDVVAQVSCSAAGSRDCIRRRLPGAVVVAAAGNTGGRAHEWPGASVVPGIVGVAASTEQDTLADFSTYGGQILVAAPGEQIISSVPGGDYAAWSGTSMAAPFVSGVAALVRAHNPRLRPVDVVKRITCGDKFRGPVNTRLNAATALGL